MTYRNAAKGKLGVRAIKGGSEAALHQKAFALEWLHAARPAK